jgi:hypothetical protein
MKRVRFPEFPWLDVVDEGLALPKRERHFHSSSWIPPWIYCGLSN